jgi:hypothetical protein
MLAPYKNLLTKILSPIFKVGYIEVEGILKGWTIKALIINANISAIING